MLPRDWDGADADADDYLRQLQDWKDERDRLSARQDTARRALDAASARLGVLTGWLDALSGLRAPVAEQSGPYQVDLAEVEAIGRALDALTGLLADRREAYAVATSRLLGDVPAGEPLVLLPLRLETHWTDEALLVRMYADDIGVRTHDPRLTTAERAAGNRYWAAAAGADPGAAVTGQAWEELVRQTGAPRAAWVVRGTDPARPAAPGRDSPWDLSVSADLMPDRFAVVAIADRSIRAGTVTWGAPIPPTLPYSLFDPAGPAGTPSWLTDFATAEANGMAVRIPLRPGDAPVDALLVVGVRGGPAGDALGDLLAGHEFSGGAELLADGAPTNNSGDLRAAHDAGSQAGAARGHRPGAVVPGPGSAGAELATLLGVDPGVVGGWRRAGEPRGAVRAALTVLVGLGARGALRDALGPAGDAWPLLGAHTPAPTMRIGRQPYGVLPVTTAAGWVPQPGERGGALARPMTEWGRSAGPPGQLDPLDPPASGAGVPRTADRPDDLEALLLELPGAYVWAGDATAYAGVAELVGPAAGPASAASFLTAIADAGPAQLPGLAAGQPSLLARVAVAAKAAAQDPDARAAVDAALRTLAGSIDDPAVLAVSFTATLDAASHRFDAWITAAVTERLHAQRAAGAPARVGAYGWLLDLRPAKAPRSAGHVLAPSLAHAATAAVLRAGYLAEVATGGRVDGSRQPMAVDLSSARVRGALDTLNAVRAGQPPAAVLGRAFEDDLIAAGLQRYLATFRKLTRFRTGTRLEELERVRADAVAVLAQRRGELTERRDLAAVAAGRATAAAELLRRAQADQQAAETAAAPYTAMRARLHDLDETLIPGKAAELARIDAERPVPGTRSRKIKVPAP